jgi:hypothetical protein
MHADQPGSLGYAALPSRYVEDVLGDLRWGVQPRDAGGELKCLSLSIPARSGDVLDWSRSRVERVGLGAPPQTSTGYLAL